jgi:hypothetical protein
MRIGTAAALDTRRSDAKLICPSCQSAAGAVACGDGQITFMDSSVSRRREGRFAIVTPWARDAMDAGRINRRVMRLADGEAMWS